MEPLSLVADLYRLAKEHGWVAAMLVLAAGALLVAAVVWFMRRNPLMIEPGPLVRRPMASLGHAGFPPALLAQVCRVLVSNPDGITIEGVTVAIRCHQQWREEHIQLLRDGVGDHPFNINPGPPVPIYVVASAPGIPEYFFAYDPRAKEPETIKKYELGLDVEITVSANHRRPKKAWFSVSEDGEGTLGLYRSTPPAGRSA